jgi:hypothetical protein
MTFKAGIENSDDYNYSDKRIEVYTSDKEKVLPCAAEINYQALREIIQRL